MKAAESGTMFKQSRAMKLGDENPRQLCRWKQRLASRRGTQRAHQQLQLRKPEIHIQPMSPRSVIGFKSY